MSFAGGHVATPSSAIATPRAWVRWLVHGNATACFGRVRRRGAEPGCARRRQRYRRCQRRRAPAAPGAVAGPRPACGRGGFPALRARIPHANACCDRNCTRSPFLGADESAATTAQSPLRGPHASTCADSRHPRAVRRSPAERGEVAGAGALRRSSPHLGFERVPCSPRSGRGERSRIEGGATRGRATLVDHRESLRTGRLPRAPHPWMRTAAGRGHRSSTLRRLAGGERVRQ